MKNTKQFAIVLLLIPLLVLMSSAPKVDKQSEIAQVEKVFQSYFDGISKFDYQAMRNACTSDYILFEDGTIWTVDDHINFLKPLEGKASIIYAFKDVKSNIEGPVAWITHRNVAEATFDGKPAHFEWIESAVFIRQKGDWKMALLHSTTAKPVQNN